MSSCHFDGDRPLTVAQVYVFTTVPLIHSLPLANRLICDDDDDDDEFLIRSISNSFFNSMLYILDRFVFPHTHTFIYKPSIRIRFYAVCNLISSAN